MDFSLKFSRLYFAVLVQLSFVKEISPLLTAEYKRKVHLCHAWLVLRLF